MGPYQESILITNTSDYALSSAGDEVVFLQEGSAFIESSIALTPEGCWARGRIFKVASNGQLGTSLFDEYRPVD